MKTDQLISPKSFSNYVFFFFLLFLPRKIHDIDAVYMTRKEGGGGGSTAIYGLYRYVPL